MFDISKHDQLRHTNRSFDLATPVDQETYNIIDQMIDDFLLVHPDSYKIVITDTAVAQKLHSIAFSGTDWMRWKKSTQMLAPLLISIAPKTQDTEFYMHLGRLYSKIGLTAINRGYYVGYNDCICYRHPAFVEVEEVLHMRSSDIDTSNFIPRSFVCIGNKLSLEQPHNWCHINQRIIPSYQKNSFNFIREL